MSILQSIMDTSMHAIMVIDESGNVIHINKKAKDCFGLVNLNDFSHGEGKIEKGDLVLIADSSLGGDDGELKASDLKAIGIDGKKIKKGDMLLAAGCFEDKSFKPIYKSISGSEARKIQIAASWKRIPFKVEMGYNKSEITVGETSYSMSYFLNIGQLVVVDSKTKKVKFWQEKGYSARKEGIGFLLRGKSFSAKHPNMETEIIGRNFRSYFEGKEFVKDLDAVMCGELDSVSDGEYAVNGFPLVASVIPIREDGKTSGLIVKFQKIDDIKTTILERNLAIKTAEKMYQEMDKVFMMDDSTSFSGIFGSSTAMAAVRRKAYKLSQLDCNILITGESGTGKSFLAENIAKAQNRKGPFIKVDCTTIPPNLFESEMFGYVPGSFTGASTKGKAGYFEAADGGTIFLDEIGEIPIGIQAKFLNVIQNKELCRVGSTKTLPVDVRIIAATNRNLKKEVAEGSFRQDLYYRLSAFSIELPPLRDCHEDICFIIDNLMDKLRVKYKMPDKVLSGEAFSKLLSYDWPGNIREIENVLESAVALSESDIIYEEQICLEDETTLHETLKEHIASEEKKMIRKVLIQCRGNKKEAMERLGLSKSVFYTKIKGYNIET